MSEQVKVEDLEVFRLFRAAMLKFKQAAEQALSTADSQIAHTQSWLEGEQASYWQGQLRKRTEAATRARDAVRQKKLYKDSSGRTPSAVEEEKILAKCVAAVEEAQRKIEAIRRWLPRLEKEAGLYRGGVARLQGTVSVEVPKAVALLDRLEAALEQYVQIEGPAVSVAEGQGAVTPGESMARGGETAEPKAEGKSGSAPAEQAGATPRKEGGDVAGGK